MLVRTLGILFYVKKAKINKDKEAPIYLRITVNGERAEYSTKCLVNPDVWDNNAGKVKGNNEYARTINVLLDTVRTQVYKYLDELQKKGTQVTALAIKNAMTGKDEENYTIIQVFENHNAKIKKLIGKDVAEGTYERYVTACKHLKDFIRWKYRKDDILLRDIKLDFIESLEFFLKTEKGNAHNTALKYIKNFRKIIRSAIAHGWIEKDPFANYKTKLIKVNRNFLTPDELQIIQSKNFDIPRLQHVLDVFIFCCYTGLAYADVQKLKAENLVLGIDGNLWVHTYRVKTKIDCDIPLLEPAKVIIEKYRDHPLTCNKGFLLPVLSNQKMNSYLKEIADLCGIKKNLTMHLARHTFATTVTLTKGISIESVSSMLGHTNIKTTQHYAKILKQKVAEEMNLLKAVYVREAKVI
jgi:site-specific recombinase XerD